MVTSQVRIAKAAAAAAAHAPATKKFQCEIKVQAMWNPLWVIC
jgi:hypothetical protein